MRSAALLFTLCFYQSLQAQVIIFEEDFSAGIPATWYLVNSDNLTPAAAVDTFDNAWISFIYDGDTCAASTSFYEPSGQSADYLITPRISLNTFSKLVWSARSYDASYPDGYLVLISTTDSSIASFTDTVFVKPEENFYWQTRSVQLDLEGYANEDIFVAFKNNTTDGFVLMIDDVKVQSSDFASIETENERTFSVYPNPTNGIITVQEFKAGDLISIYSTTGQKLLESTTPTIDLSLLDAGMYICHIKTQNGSYSQILTKN